MKRNGIVFEEPLLAEFCRKWRIQKLALFGSVLRDDFRPDSDIDVLVDFEPEAPWDLLDLVEARGELMTMVGRPVDLVERAALKNPYRKRSILETAEVIYDAES